MIPNKLILKKLIYQNKNEEQNFINLQNLIEAKQFESGIQNNFPEIKEEKLIIKDNCHKQIKNKIEDNNNGKKLEVNGMNIDNNPENNK